ncbi:MAG: LolA family protein [Planctomycetota bacterium]|jgi:hypothetical protein
MKQDKLEKILNDIASEQIPTEIEQTFDENWKVFSKALPKLERYILWERIMKNKITQIAAAVIILVGFLAVISLIAESDTSAYAVQQTIEAMKNVSVVHIFGRNWEEKEVEMWAQINPETGRGEYYWLSDPSIQTTIVATPEESYIYNASDNTVRIKDGLGISSVFSPGRFLEEMTKMTNRLDGTISDYMIYDPKAGKDLILLIMASERIDLQATVDPDTKLPLSVDIIGGSQPGSNEVLKRAEQMYYNEQLPEGIFEFEVPLGSEIVDDTIIDAQRQLPDSVIGYAVNYHLEIINNVTMVNNIFANTHIYVVDGEFNLLHGGFVGVYNDTGRVWEEEVRLMNTDRANLAFFDETGKKQKIKVIQKKAMSPGKYSIYWQLEEPIEPGQARGGIYWVNDSRKLSQKPDGSNQLTMNNFFGSEVIESFILIMPSGTQLSQKSEDYTSSVQIDGYDIYIWKKHIPKGRENTVNVSLEPPVE